MSRVYLVRHGQAGLRDNYDTLSDHGRAQASHLGNWFRREGIAPDQVIAGPLKRQVETARSAFPDREIAIEPRLAEFDLDAVYRALAPVLCEIDPDFRREFETMQVAMQSPDAKVHRQWNQCDVKVFQAWYSGRFPYDGESWAAFRARCVSLIADLRALDGNRQVVISTSATPIALILAELLGVDDGKAMRMAGACYNTSVTTLRARDGDVSLITFNAIAHLDDPSMRTFR